MLGAIFHEERQKEEDGLQPKLCEASDNNGVDGIGLDFQLLNGLEIERKREEWMQKNSRKVEQPFLR